MLTLGIIDLLHRQKRVWQQAAYEHTLSELEEQDAATQQRRERADLALRVARSTAEQTSVMVRIT
jgi:hypothetical protein